MVACHAVYTGADYAKPLNFDSWFLLDYQKVRATPLECSPPSRYHTSCTFTPYAPQLTVVSVA